MTALSFTEIEAYILDIALHGDKTQATGGAA